FPKTPTIIPRLHCGADVRMSFIFCPPSRYRDEIRILKSGLRVAWQCPRETDECELLGAGRIPHHATARDEGHPHRTQFRDEKSNGGGLQPRACTDPKRMAFRCAAKRRSVFIHS